MSTQSPRRHNILAHPPRLPMVFPSILGADFMRMGEECEAVLGLGAEGLHVDVMDGHFVPNLTMGPAMVGHLRRRFAGVYLDVHLMVTNPEQFVEPFAEAGADCLTFHIEAVDGKLEHNEHALIEQIRAAGCEVGIALNPSTTAGAVEHVLKEVDLVLVMSVFPGFAGQKFMPEVLEKAMVLKPLLGPTTRLEMDGGINGGTVEGVLSAGCEVVVAASALFESGDRAATMRHLRGEA